MEIVNIFLVVVAVAMAQVEPSYGTDDLQQAIDDALTTIEISRDLAKEVADDAVVKIEDIVNSLNFALAEARFSLIHFANLAAINNLTALDSLVPDDPTASCITKDMVGGVKDTMTSTGLDMVNCFTGKINQANEIYQDTLALDDEVAAIMPNAIARMETCSEEADLVCVEIQLKEILDETAKLEEELADKVIWAKELTASLNSHLEQCLGHLVTVFIADVGKYGSKMVSCLVKGF